jgi:sugar lactone lactonase YvrE
MMRSTPRKRSVARFRRYTVPLLVAGVIAGAGTATAAAQPGSPGAAPDKVITLPGASAAEGITAGAGSTYYAGDLFRGDIFRGDIRRGTAKLFIDAPEGRIAIGMAADVRRDLLFVAGGFTGQAYVYDTRTRATVATVQLGDTSTSFINDVALTAGGAWFTDSLQARLYFVPVSKHGVPGTVRTLDVSGPAGELSGDFNLNGIQAAHGGKTLIVAHSTNGRVYTVNPRTGASALIEGIETPSPDGLVLEGRQLWVVQSANQISRFTLSADLSRATLKKVITSPAFATPTTAALFGHRLAVVNSHFDTGVPPTSPTYEVVVTNS